MGVAKIAMEKVIPAIGKGQTGVVAAIASRATDKARAAARRFAIPRAYGSYEELLADPEIDAIYNPLPNHLHVPWSLASAGKARLRQRVQGASRIAPRYRPKLLLTPAVVTRPSPCAPSDPAKCPREAPWREPRKRCLERQ